MNSKYLLGILTRTQYKYWVEYYYNGMNLREISEKYGVHITTVSKVMQNARKRYNAFVKEGD